MTESSRLAETCLEGGVGLEGSDESIEGIEEEAGEVVPDEGGEAGLLDAVEGIIVFGLDGPAMGAIDFGDVVAAGLLRALEVELLGEVGAVEGAGVAPEKRREVVGNEAP